MANINRRAFLSVIPGSACASAQPRRYRWTQIASRAPFAPRDGAGALSWRGRMRLIGGWNPPDKQHFPLICSNDRWFSTNGVEWLEVPETPWKPRHATSVVVHNNHFWMVAGNNMESCASSLDCA